MFYSLKANSNQNAVNLQGDHSIRRDQFVARSIGRKTIRRRNFLFFSVLSIAQLFFHSASRKKFLSLFYRDLLISSLLIKSCFQEKKIDQVIHFYFVNYTTHRKEFNKRKEIKKEKTI